MRGVVKKRLRDRASLATHGMPSSGVGEADEDTIVDDIMCR